MNLLPKVNIRGVGADKSLPNIQWSKNNCIFRDPVDRQHLYVSLGSAPHKDEGADMLGMAIEALGNDPGIIEFVALPSSGYKEYLEKLGRPKDTFVNRREYLLHSSPRTLEREWEMSGHSKTDIAATLLFSIALPTNMDSGREYITYYRLEKRACLALTELLESSYDDESQIFLSREVIHWGDFLQNSERYFLDGVSALNGGPRTYMGADLEQRFGSPMDARFIAPLLCLPVVLRRHLPRIMNKVEAVQYLQGCVPEFRAEQVDAIFAHLDGSGIAAATVFNRLIPEALMKDEVEKIFAEKGCKFSV